MTGRLRRRLDEIKLYGEILRPGTEGMLKAEMAKQLVDDNPDLGHPDKRDQLLAGR